MVFTFRAALVRRVVRFRPCNQTAAQQKFSAASRVPLFNSAPLITSASNQTAAQQKFSAASLVPS
jgi:hypothetical protein